MGVKFTDSPERLIMAKLGRRRGFVSWFVEPYKQVRLGLVFLLVNFLFSFLIVGVFGYYVWEMYQAVASYFQLSTGESAVAMEKFTIPLVIGGTLIILFILSTILVSVKFTHEIYGPLVSINRYLDDMLAGLKPTPIKLRDSDQLQDLANKLNSLAERVQGSQRAGTMIAIYRYLDELKEGKKPPPLKLRDADQLTDLATKLNDLAVKLP